MLAILRCISLLLFCAIVPAEKVEWDNLARAWTETASVEYLEETSLLVNGTLPAWLKGQYFLASSSVFSIFHGKHNLTHAFDGFSKIIRWRFSGAESSPTLRARLLNSTYLSKSRKSGDVVPCSNIGGASPPFSAAQRAEAPWAGTSDNFNVNIHSFGRAAPYVSLSDVSDPQAAAAHINDDTLASTSFAWSDSWSHPIADRIAPAHPRIIPDGSNDSVGLITRLDPFAVGGIGKHELILYRVNASLDGGLKRDILHRIRVEKLPYVHSIGVTKNFAIVCAGPLNWDIEKLLLGKDASDSWKWDKEGHSSTIYKLPLDADAPVEAFSVPPFFAFHHLNAWEDSSGSLNFDVVVNKGLNATNGNPAAAFSFSTLRNTERRDVIKVGGGAVLTRYSLPESAKNINSSIHDGKGSIKEVAITKFDLVDISGRKSTNIELPSFNRALTGVPYCFAYLWAPQVLGDPRWSEMAILKKNLCDVNAPILKWQREGHFPGEATFVGRPGGEEDDGVLLVAVHDSNKESCYLLILNATNMSDIAEIHTPSEPEKNSKLLAFGLHGLFSTTWHDAASQ